MMAMLTLDQKYRPDHNADLRSGPGNQVVVHKVAPGDEFKIGDATLNRQNSAQAQPQKCRSISFIW